MGVDIKELIEDIKENVKIEQLNGKKIAFDAYNALYQF